MKQVSELRSNQITKIHKLIKEMGFKISKNSNDKVIFFNKGYRIFSLYSSNIEDPVYGLSMSFDLESFLNKNYKIKTKHSTSLQELIYNQEKSHDEAFQKLNWTVTDYYNFTDFDHHSFNDDIDLELIFEVSIRDLKHIVVDDNVYEGEIGPIRSLLTIKREELIDQVITKDFRDYLSSLNQ